MESLVADFVQFSSFISIFLFLEGRFSILRFSKNSAFPKIIKLKIVRQLIRQLVHSVPSDSRTGSVSLLVNGNCAKRDSIL